MVTKPNASPELQDCPKIAVAGQEWPVPLFGPRQNRKLIPGLMKLRGLKDNPQEMSEDQLNGLYDIVYTALTRAHPDLKRDEFDDWPVPVYELLGAFPVIAAQTGLIRQVKTEPGQPAGEAESHQIGTP